MTDTNVMTGEQVVRSYYDILRAGAEAFEPDRLRALLAPDLDFEGPIAGRRTGAEPFVKGVSGFVYAARHVELIREIYAGDRAAVLYDAQLPGGPVRFAEFFELGDGRIQSLRLMYDAAEFRARGGQ